LRPNLRTLQALSAVTRRARILIDVACSRAGSLPIESYRLSRVTVVRERPQRRRAVSALATETRSWPLTAFTAADHSAWTESGYLAAAIPPAIEATESLSPPVLVASAENLHGRGLNLFADSVARGDAVQAGENSSLRCWFHSAKTTREPPNVANGACWSRVVASVDRKCLGAKRPGAYRCRCQHSPWSTFRPLMNPSCALQARSTASEYSAIAPGNH
jgi:hypothetical protein